MGCIGLGYGDLTAGLLRVELAPEEYQLHSEGCRVEWDRQIVDMGTESRQATHTHTHNTVGCCCCCWLCHMVTSFPTVPANTMNTYSFGTVRDIETRVVMYRGLKTQGEENPQLSIARTGRHPSQSVSQSVSVTSSAAFDDTRCVFLRLTEHDVN